MKVAGFFTWIISGSGKNAAETESIGTAEDYEEFISYLRHKDRPFAKPGRTVKDEFGFWLADRMKKQATTVRSAVPQA